MYIYICRITIYYILSVVFVWYYVIFIHVSDYSCSLFIFFAVYYIHVSKWSAVYPFYK